MTVLTRFRCQWTGFAGAPGVSTFYFDNTAASDPVQWLHTFFSAIVSCLPGAVHIGFPTLGDNIDDATGTLTGNTTSPGAASVSGSDFGSYAAPAGPMIQWHTGTIADGHRLMGRTYLVPGAGAAMDGDGTVSAAKLSVLQAAGTALVTSAAGSMRVWHRPVYGPKPTRPLIRAGSSGSVTAAVVPDRQSSLRSRRD